MVPSIWLRLRSVLISAVRRCNSIAALPLGGMLGGFPSSTSPSVSGNLQGYFAAAASWLKPASEFGIEAFLF